MDPSGTARKRTGGFRRGGSVRYGRLVLSIVAVVVVAVGSSVAPAAAAPTDAQVVPIEPIDPPDPVRIDQPPRIELTISPEEPVVGEVVTFDASDSYDPDGGSLQFSWDVDAADVELLNGGSVLEATFDEPGDHFYQLRVFDDEGDRNEEEGEIFVRNELPQVELTISPEEPVVGEVVTFDASDSYDPDGGSLSYKWDVEGSVLDVSNDGSILEARFDEPGDHFYRVRVFDDEGGVSSVEDELFVREDLAPTASFRYSPLDPTVDELVTFDASGSTDDGGILVYAWDFDGDGAFDRRAATPTVRFAYDEPDEYIARLTVFDGRNQTGTTRQVVTVEADDPPTAGFDYHPSIPTVGTSVTFDASASTDDDEIVRYEWRFGDGTRETTADERVSHTYDDDGSYTVTLTVTDRDGLSHTVERGVTVDPEAVLEPLRADFDFLPVDPLVGEPVQFDAGTSGGPDRTVVRYEWTFGDDAPIVGSVVETHAFTTAGRHLVALNVTDTEGTTATLVRYVTVSPVEPLALTHEPTEPTVDEPVQFAVTGPSPPVGRPVTYEWDFTSDGVVDADGPAVTVSHRYERAGDYTVTLTVVVDDVFLASAESTVSVRDASVVTDVSERVDAEEAAGSPDSDTGSGSSDSTGSDGEADPPAVGDSEPATGDGSDDQVTRFDSPLGLVVVAGLATVGLLAYAAFVVRPSPPPEPVVQDRSARDADDAEDEDDDDRSRPALVVDAYHPQTGDEPLTDEYVRFRNVGETVADLSRATVRNDEGDVYTFPAEYPLEPDATVSLYTGSGTDGEYELYWGATESVWDVDADRIVLRDVLGNPLVAYQYPERGS